MLNESVLTATSKHEFFFKKRFKSYTFGGKLKDQKRIMILKKKMQDPDIRSVNYASEVGFL